MQKHYIVYFTILIYCNYAGASIMNEISVLLIYPPNKWGNIDRFCQPLGVLTLGSALKEAGIKVSVLDLAAEGWPKDKLEQYITEGNFTHVGITILTPFREVAYSILSLAKKINPEIITLVGGPHISLMGKEVRAECEDVDIIVSGEAEQEIVNIITNPTKKYYELGIVKELDKSPVPDRSFVRHIKYNQLSGLWIGDTASMRWIRGCQWRKCTFCSRNELTMTPRRRSPEKIIEEIAIIQNELKYKNLFVVDDSIMFNSRHAKEILELKIKEGLDIPFWALTRSDQINEESLRLLRKANCRGLEIGIESVVPRTIKMFKKTNEEPKIWVKKLGEKLEAANRNNILTVGTVIVGSPNETKEEIQQTMLFCKKSKVDVIIAFAFQYLIGSELWRVAIEEGRIKPHQMFTYNDKKFGSTEFSTAEIMKMAEKVERQVNSPIANPMRYVRIARKLVKQRSWSMITMNLLRLPIVIKNYLFSHPYEMVPEELHS